ncbi:MAG: hypothetical protein AAF922_17320 [Pseudomonadota bacterium]
MSVVFDISALPLPVNLALFALSAFVVWVAGARLALIGDEISERFRLEKEFIGLVFLATISKLPEIVTSVTGARIESPTLVLGALFGSIAFNTAILAIADFFIVRGALTSWPRNPSNALSGVLLITLLSLILALTLAGDPALFGYVGAGGLALALGFPLIVVLQRRVDRRASWAPVDLPDETETGILLQGRRDIAAWPTRKLLTLTVIYVAAILGAGLLLTLTADALAAQMGIGSAFVGVTFLAIATSLPEFSTTIASVRIGAYTMALANIFGSNLITVTLIAPADLAFPGGAILSQAGPAAQLGLATGITVTAIYVAGMLIRRKTKLWGAGVDSWLVLAVYLGSLVPLFLISS